MRPAASAWRSWWGAHGGNASRHTGVPVQNKLLLTRARGCDTDCRGAPPADLERELGFARERFADPCEPVPRMLKEIALEGRIARVGAPDLRFVPAGRKCWIDQRRLSEPPAREAEP